MGQQSTMEKYIKYDEEFGLAICKQCKVGLPDTYVLLHFSRHHKETWRVHRHEFRNYVKGLRLTPSNALCHPVETRAPIPCLEIKDGFSCGEADCIYCCSAEKWMQKHCRERHGVQNMQAREWFPCKIQTLLGNPNIRYVMIVSRGQCIDIIDTLLSSRKKTHKRNTNECPIHCLGLSFLPEFKNTIYPGPYKVPLMITSCLYELLGCNEPNGLIALKERICCS